MSKQSGAKKDMLVGLISVVFGIGFYALTYTFKLVKMPNTVNAAFFPRILGTAAILLGAVIFAQGFAAYQSADKSKAEEKKKKTDVKRVIGVMAVLLAAALSLKYLGFILTMPWMMFLLFLLVNKMEIWNLPLYLAVSVILPVVVFFIFYYIFKTLLPMGLLKNFLSTYFL